MTGNEAVKRATTRRVALSNVLITQRQVIGNLLQLCLHDYSEFADAGTSDFEVDWNGRFAYEWLDSYWQGAERVPLLIRAEDRSAGFSLINRWSALDRPLDHALAEFFILRKYRRLGIGAQAAKLIFERFPGRWEVAVAQSNRPALSFWRRAIAAAIPGDIAEYEGDGNRWRGTVFCFRAGASRGGGSRT